MKKELFKISNNELIFSNNNKYGIKLDTGDYLTDYDNYHTIPKEYCSDYIYLGLDNRSKANFKLIVLNHNYIAEINDLEQYITYIYNDEVNITIIKIDRSIFEKYMIVDLIVYNIDNTVGSFIYSNEYKNLIELNNSNKLFRVFRLFKSNDNNKIECNVNRYKADISISKYGLNFYLDKILV